ncbi:MAG: HAD family hydrolase [Pirellulaceae bacterium]
MTKTPRFLYFDLGNVLVNFDHQIAIDQLASLTRATPDAIRQLVFDSPMQIQYEQGEMVTAEFCQQIRQHTGSTATDDEMCHAASNIFWVNHPILPLVGALQMAGFRMGILSNTCEAHWDYIESRNYGILKAFHHAVLSFREKACKPSATIYERAAAQANCEAAELFFVDDRPDNVQGARESGIDAVLFESTAQLAAELSGRGLRFNL